MEESLFQLGLKALIRNAKGEILLMHADTSKYLRPIPPFWDMPGGRIKTGESIHEGLIREVEEEIGTGNELLEIAQLQMVVSNHRIPTPTGEDYGLILGIFNCKLADEKKIETSDEHLGFDWFSPKEAAELLKVKYPKELTDVVAEL